MSRSVLIRFSGLIAMLGGVLWITSWVLNLFTQDGTRAILGLSERGWRRLLDPAMVSFIACLSGVRAVHRGKLKGLGKAGFVLSLVALATMLAGNVAEFCLCQAITLASMRLASGPSRLSLRSTPLLGRPNALENACWEPRLRG